LKPAQTFKTFMEMEETKTSLKQEVDFIEESLFKSSEKDHLLSETKPKPSEESKIEEIPSQKPQIPFEMPQNFIPNDDFLRGLNDFSTFPPQIILPPLSHFQASKIEKKPAKELNKKWVLLTKFFLIFNLFWLFSGFLWCYSCSNQNETITWFSSYQIDRQNLQTQYGYCLKYVFEKMIFQQKSFKVGPITASEQRMDHFLNIFTIFLYLYLYYELLRSLMSRKEKLLRKMLEENWKSRK